MRNTARVMIDVGADVLGVVEAESRPVLASFNAEIVKALGGEPFRHVMVIDGNDERGIDVGLVTRALPIGPMRSHVDDPLPSGQPVLARLPGVHRGHALGRAPAGDGQPSQEQGLRQASSNAPPRAGRAGEGDLRGPPGGDSSPSSAISTTRPRAAARAAPRRHRPEGRVHPLRLLRRRARARSACATPPTRSTTCSCRPTCSRWSRRRSGGHVAGLAAAAVGDLRGTHPPRRGRLRSCRGLGRPRPVTDTGRLHASATRSHGPPR